MASASVHAVTDPSARGRGIFVELERKHEREATERGVACVLAFASAPTAPLFLGPLGWTAIGKLRVWARPAWANVAGDGVRRSSSTATRRAAGRTTSSATTSTSSGATSTRRAATKLVATDAGYAVVWPAKRHKGRTISVVADHVGATELLSRGPAAGRGRGCQFALPAPEQRRAYLAAGFLPTPQTLNFMGKALAGRLNTDPARLARHPRRHGLLLMRRLIFITQQVDPGHPALAATVPKIRALAALVDEVVVLADRVLPGTLPDNCRSLSFASRTKAGRGLRFEAALTKELARRSRVAIVAHMCPIYAVLAAPLARPLGVPLLLWFTHWKRTRTLEAAEKASTAVVSASTGARFPSTRRRSSPSATASTSTSSRADPRASGRTTSASRRSAATRARRGWRRSSAAWRSLRTRPRRAARSARPGAVGSRARASRPSSSGSSASSASTRASASTRPCCAPRCPEMLRPRRLPRQQHGGGRARQDRLRGGGELPARDRLESCLRQAVGRPARAARLRPRRPRAAGGAHRAARDDDPGAARLDRPRAARAGGGGPLGATLGRADPRGGDSDEHERREGPALPEGGRHLRLGGAPALAPAEARRARLGRADAHAPRERARRLGLRARARGARRAARRDPDRARLRPRRLHAARVLRRPRAPDDPPHAPRPRRRVRADRRRARGRARARVDEARLQRVPRGTRVRARRPRRGEPRARPHRHLARPRAVPRAGRGLRRRRTSRSSTTASPRAASRRRTPSRRRGSSASAG